MTLASALYRGAVVHRRSRPRKHRLRYRVFWLLLDIDEIDGLDRRLRLFSRNRFNLLGFHDRDHAPEGVALRAHVEGRLRSAGIEPPGGPIRLLSMPRMLGYVFNPISVYFCHRPDGGLGAVLYAVNNTFGQHHDYVVAIAPGEAGSGMLRHGCGKSFYVSPFLGMDLSYGFHVQVPAERAVLAVTVSDTEGPLVAASMAGTRTEITDGSILKTSLAYPLLTAKVVAGIHFEALKLWWKGVPLTRRPPPPAVAATRIDGKMA